MKAITAYKNNLSVMNEPLDQNPAAVYLANLAESGRKGQKYNLDLIAGFLTTGRSDCFSCNWSRVRFQHTQAVRSTLVERYAPATVNMALSALRGTLKAAWLLGQMSAEDYHKAASVKNIQVKTIPTGRELSNGEMSALMEICQDDPSPAGRRDAALIGVMYVGGLRRSEIVSLNLENYFPDTEQLVVIKGKGRKQRTVYLANGAGLAMADWLEVRGRDPGPLFTPVNKAGKISISSMTTQAIYNILARRSRQAGVSHFSPHDLRRTFVSHLLEAGADIAIVAKLAGHANVQTTARYDRRPEEAKKKAAGLLHVPYRARINIPRLGS